MTFPSPRTLDQVKVSLANAKLAGSDVSFAKLLLKHGRLEPDAAEYVLAHVERESDESIPVDDARDCY
jgi:hypothetical protein